jgi:hypothetical protein
MRLTDARRSALKKHGELHMKKMRSQVVVVMALGILALLGVFFSHLALTDIY